MRRQSKLIGAILVAVLLAVAGRDWLALAWDAWDYPTATPHARTQIAVAQNRVYLAAGVDGIEVIDLPSAQRHELIAPSAPLDRIDDVAIADGLLFALDATPPGFLQTYAFNGAGDATIVGSATPVPVGPFSGVSAAAGIVIVSGGTSLLTLREYDAHGRLGTTVVTADFGRGQPDVALRGDGARAVISTHLVGPRFGLTFVEIQRAPLRIRELGRLRLRNAGFTAGGYKPAHFPLAATWRGDLVYLAYGGGLDVIDAVDARHPQLRYHDPRPQPAIDVSTSADVLSIASAGAHPAVFRYRLDAAGVPALVGTWHPPNKARPAAIASAGNRTWITLHESQWRVLSSDDFSPIPPQP